ncbi:MAG: hypothetical protein NVSMB46_05180 [Candidatus Saccharimonadales bacterium]
MAMKRKEHSHAIHLKIPNWAIVIYPLLSLILVPWTLYLSVSLPTRHLTHHWDASWVGLDSVLAITLFMTGYLAFKKSRWVVIAASSAGSFLVLDAWFDVMSQKGGVPLYESLILAFFIELPMAWISYSIAYKILRRDI